MTMPAIGPTLHPRIANTSCPRDEGARPAGTQAYSETPDQLTCKQMKLDSAKGSPPATPERQYKQQQLPDLPATLLGRRSWRLRLETRMLVPIRT
jgi:hypothetical protein